MFLQADEGLATKETKTSRLASFFTPPVIVGIIAIIPYTSLLISGERVLANSPYSDYSSFQVPMHEFAQSEFAQGRFPHWNPWVGCGIPMHATLQSSLCYPLLTPFLFLFGANFAIKVALFLHIVLGYVGQFRLGRRLGLSSIGAAVAGLVFAQNGFIASHLAVGHVAHVLACGLLPGFFESVIATCAKPSWASSAGFAITVAGLLLIGNPQVPYYGLLFGGIWAAGSLLNGTAAQHRVRVCGMFVVGLAIALLLAAIQLLPALELIRDNRGLSSRGTIAYAGEFAMDQVDLCRFVAPWLRGSPLVGMPEFQPMDFYHEKVCYLGLLTWMLIGISLVHWNSDHWTRAAILLSSLAIILSLGNSTPLFAALGRIIPGLFLFRCPARCLGVAAVLLTLLAGRGFDDMVASPKRQVLLANRQFVTGLIIADIVAIIFLDRVLTVVDVNRWLEFAKTNLQYEILIALIVGIASLVLVSLSGVTTPRVWMILSISLLFTDLWFFNLRGIRFESDPFQPLIAEIQSDSSEYRFVAARSYPFFTADEVRYSRSVPQAIRSEVRMIGTNEGGMLPAGCEVLFRKLEERPEKTLRAASCRDIISGPDRNDWIRVEGTLPRIRYLPDVVDAYPETPEGNVLRNKIHVEVDAPQSIQAHVTVAESGLLVVADTFYPGWFATVDGVLTEVLPVDACFRGIRIPPGEHLIQLYFRSNSFIAGGALSALGMVSLLVVLWLAGRTANCPIARHSKD